MRSSGSSRVAKSKTELEAAAKALAESAESSEQRALAKAIAMSARISAEDLYRESRYMIPQGDEAKALLAGMLAEEQGEDFPRETVEKLLETL